MSNFKTAEEAREFFKDDQFATKNGMVVEDIGEDWAVCGMDIERRHKNAYGGVMGGAIFTLADFAFAVASNNVHNLTVAQQVSINFLSAPKGKRLTAKAKCRKDGRTSAIYIIDVTDDTGRDVAQFVGTGYKL